ncbi:MAG: Asp-tRNA(Asn)/Glu-tRNA(Gln) amidotransferase subunit GatC [Clostridia bacterium]|nr:Asp-tRNA(Asn)/Glu-tRNA(Gln) amidotransferase subunit GatC [Clostridia bacterium]
MTNEELQTYEAMAKLSLPPDTSEWALSAMAELEKSFAKLADIDTTGVPPLVSVLNAQNVMREDAAAQLVSREELLECAIEEYDGYFQVPKTLE